MTRPLWPRVGLDVDGCLAKFNEGFARLLDIQLPVGGPRQWGWPASLGVSADEEADAWEKVKYRPDFWESLEPYEDTLEVLAALDGHPTDVYFITSRVGHTAKIQTERWLRRMGYRHPTVLVVEGHAKPLVGIALNLTYFVDDKPETLALYHQMQEEHPTCQLSLINRPWNQHSLLGGEVPRHASVKDALIAFGWTM